MAKGRPGKRELGWHCNLDCLRQGGPPYPLEILVPQVLAVLVAIGLIICPERYRDRFQRA